MLIFDIGANVGNWAKANSHDDVSIVAVEASPSTFGQLLANTNTMKNITSLNFVVCDSPSTHVSFYESDNNGISTLNESWLNDPKSRFYNSANYRTIKVPCITLDELIKMYGTPNFIKIDVESAEDIVIQTLTSKVDMIAFEWASEMRDVAYRSIDHLVSLGFTRFHIQLQDAYTYRPTTFEHSELSAKTYLKTTQDRWDWGMIWAA
jgi:FkbM family methyltransferase